MTIQKDSAKFAFFYMLALIALSFMSYSIGAIIFQIINKNIPDVLSTYSGVYSSGALKFAISALIVSAPIYYIAMWQIGKNLFKGLLDKDSGVRRWLTYFILLVSSVVMIGWLIGIIYNFLDGELTAKFILKALTSIVIAAAVFSYYLIDIKREKTKEAKSMINKIYFFISLLIAVVVLVSSFFFVESPMEARNKRQDNLIMENLYRLDSAVQSYYNYENKMPESLKALTNYEYDKLRAEDILDPVSGKQYDYKVTGANSYEICADFKTSNVKREDVTDWYYEEGWVHEAGYYCISRKVIKYDEKTGLPVPNPLVP